MIKAIQVKSKEPITPLHMNVQPNHKTNHKRDQTKVFSNNLLKPQISHKTNHKFEYTNSLKPQNDKFGKSLTPKTKLSLSSDLSFLPNKEN